MNNPSSSNGNPFRTGGWRPRFGIKTILLVTLLVAVLSAALSGLLGDGASSPAARPMWLFFAVAAPMLVMIVLSIWPWIRRWIDRFNGSPK